MSIMNTLKNGLTKAISHIPLRWFWRNVFRTPLDSGKKDQPIPPEVMKFYQIRMLGKPFVEVDTKSRVWRGYVYEGVKYYEKNPSTPDERMKQ